MSYNIIKGNALSGGGAPPDGYFLAWSAADGYWVSRPGPSGAFSAGLDLSGSSSSQTVIGIQGRAIYNVAPNNNDVLTWVSANSRWEPLPGGGGGGGGFTAGGDLSGTSTSQTVIKINGATAPAAGALVTGNVLQVSGTSALTYAALNLAGGTSYVTGQLPAINQADQTMGGDITGSTAIATVIKVNGVSVPSSPATGTTLIALSPTTSMWSQIYDGYIAAGANIAGSKIAAATTGSTGVIQLAGDLAGTGISPVVTGLNGVPVNGAGLSDGYVLTYSLSDGYWKAKPGPSGSFTAAGDLTGSSTNQTVIAIQNHAVLSQVMGATEDGYALTWVNANNRWEAKPGSGGGGGGFTAGGDLSGTSTSQTVTKINGATVPVSGALTTGNLLQVSGSSALSYGALNLAGGAGYVTGVLPAANQDAQSLGGDLTGSTTLATVLRINGTIVPASPSANQVLVAISGSAANWSQITDGYIAASANIAGSKIANATSGTTGVIQLAGDIGGTATAPLVAKLQGTTVSNTVPTDGYVLTYEVASTSWKPKPSAGGGGGGGFTAGGDLAGSSTNQTVTGLQTRPVNSTAPADGYVLTWKSVDGYWAGKPMPSSPTSFQYVQPHDNTYSPIALYQFNNSIADSSGNGRDLILNAGAIKYGDIAPKLTGIFCDNTLKLVNSSPAFRITGDMTVEMLLTINPLDISGSPTYRAIFGVMASGELQNANYLSGLLLYHSTNPIPNYFSSFWEYGAGTNLEYVNTNGAAPHSQVFHFAMVRESNVVTMYLNGRVLGAPSGALTPPDTVSGIQSLWIGGSDSSDTGFFGMISSFKFIGRALTASEVNSEFERTVGAAYSRTITLAGYSGTSDGYQHLDIVNGTESNIGVGASTFKRVGSVQVNTTLYASVTYTFSSIIEATAGQTAEVRLYNVTDGAVITSSTLTTTSSAPTVLSAVIVLPAGNKIYEAQIRVTGSPGINDGVICSGSQILVR